MARRTETDSGFQTMKAALREKRADRLYFFHGEEVYLLRYYTRQLRRMLIDPATEAFNFYRLNSETFSVRALVDAVEKLPMMAEHTLVWVDEIDIFRLDEADRTRLAEMFADMPDYCTVVFTYETTPWKPDKRQKKLWDAVSRYGQIVEFARQSQRDLIAWITRHFAARGKHISPDLCAYLIDITGGTMTALAGEIAKIAAYSGADAIKKTDIDAVTEPVLDAVVFQMTDLLGQGNYGAALKSLRQLLQLQQEPLAILGAIGAHIRRLGAACTLLSRGKGSGELARLYGLGDYAARKTISVAAHFTERFCARAAALVVETDSRIKTSFDEPERLLELLIVQLSQEARHA